MLKETSGNETSSISLLKQKYVSLSGYVSLTSENISLQVTHLLIYFIYSETSEHVDVSLKSETTNFCT